MKFRKSLLIALCVGTFGGLSAPMTASAEVQVYFNTAPPPLRVEAVPAPRRGYFWVPGYWEGRGHRHVWHAGYWQRERRGYHYVPPTWVERNNRWYYEQGRWNRGDTDRDGVPNAVDRAPNNPTRH